MRQIYSLLFALKNNIPDDKYVSRKYVDQYNTLIGRLSAEVGAALEDFKISESLLEHTSGVIRPGVGFVSFGEKECERGFLLAKLDAILILFKLEEEKTSMGLQTPQT